MNDFLVWISPAAIVVPVFYAVGLFFARNWISRAASAWTTAALSAPTSGRESWCSLVPEENTHMGEPDHTPHGQSERQDSGMDDAKRMAEVYALASDRNLIGLIAWRFVVARCEDDPAAFNGLLVSDLTHAEQVLDWIKAEASKPPRRDPFGSGAA